MSFNLNKVRDILMQEGWWGDVGHAGGFNGHPKISTRFFTYDNKIQRFMISEDDARKIFDPDKTPVIILVSEITGKEITFKFYTETIGAAGWVYTPETDDPELQHMDVKVKKNT